MKEDNEKNNRSPHVLNASSNLLGLCFVVLTSLKVLKFSDTTLIDELTIGATILFMISCILSFLLIRRNNKRYENIADLTFLLGLITLFVTTILFSFNVIR
jgi:amino acid permease